VKNVTLMLTPTGRTGTADPAAPGARSLTHGWVTGARAVWLLFVELLGLIALPVLLCCFPPPVRPRLCLCQAHGRAAVGFLSWIIVSLKLAYFTRTTIGLMLLLLTVAAAGIGILAA